MTPPRRPPDARLMAIGLVGSVLDDGASLGEATVENGGDPRDRAYARHLAYGTLRWLTALDWLAGRLLQKPFKPRDQDIHRLVLLGLFQLWQDNTAGHAAVNETAGCARKLGKPWATGVINAVLRRFQREQSALLEALGQNEARFAHPQWLLERLQQDWPDDWPAIVTANNQAAPLWMRLGRRGAREETLWELEDSGLTVTPHPFAPDAIRVEPARPVQDVPGFGAGRLSVQDPAAQFAADLLQCHSGDRVLDACAAPGGKTGHLLERHPDIELAALDRSPLRLRQVGENLERLGLASRAVLHTADAACPEEWWDGRPFERILLDAPCSATGVIRRHPEIKWLRSAEQVEAAAMQQSKLLDALWPLLKPGGILLYATCSVLKTENSREAEAFLQRQNDATADLPDLPWGRRSGPGQQVFPGDEEMDGFYYARFRKQA